MSKQWWITGFDPDYAHETLSDATKLKAVYTVRFDTLGYGDSFDEMLEQKFHSRWVVESERWIYDPSDSVFRLKFITEDKYE